MNHFMLTTISRLQVSKKDDLHPHVLVDLLLTKTMYEEKYDSRILSGYIQQISLYPFAVVLYTENSMKLCRRVTQKKNAEIFLDATSTIVASLPSELDSRRIFYYAAVVKNADSAPAPVLEFYTAQQDHVAISYCLESFFSKYYSFCF